MPTKVHLVKVMVFPIVMYGYEIWTIKKAECRRIEAFELWCWRRLLKVPWRTNQSILKEISPECSNTNYLRYPDGNTQRAESEEDFKKPLDEVKRGE